MKESANTIKKCIWVLLLMCAVSNVSAQSLRRAFAIGSTMDDDAGTALVIDRSNNVIVTGSFTGPDADFNPAIATKNLPHVGGKDVFIAKYDSQGLLQWAVSFGGVDDDEARAIAVDGSGNIYVTGYVEGQVDFDPSSQEEIHTPFGDRDIFLVKFSASGAHLWSRQMGGSFDQEGLGITVDKSNNIYVTGYMIGTNVDFNPEGSPSYLDSEGLKDVFFCKYTSSGSYQWAGNIGGNYNEQANCIVSDKSNNLYIGGYFSGNNVDFNPASGVNTIDSYGGDDAFVFKLTSSGGYQWVMGVGGTGSDRCNAIALDSLNNFYITGSFTGSNADFNPVGGTQKLASKGFEDIFVAKYSLSGATYQGAFAVGGSFTDQATSICVDRTNNVFITGMFSSPTVDFDPGSGIASLSATFEDCFIAKYDENRKFQWAYELGASQGCMGNAVAVNKNLELVATGYFSGEADFDPEPTVKVLQSVGASKDIFLTTVTGITVGVNESAPADNIVLYPNPCQDVLYIESVDAHTHPNNIVIYDVLGRARKTFTLQTDHVWVGDLPTGNYSIEVSAAGETYLLHFIKR